MCRVEVDTFLSVWAEMKTALQLHGEAEPNTPKAQYSTRET